MLGVTALQYPPASVMKATEYVEDASPTPGGGRNRDNFAFSRHRSCSARAASTDELAGWRFAALEPSDMSFVKSSCGWGWGGLGCLELG